MNRTAIIASLANLSDDETRCELSDWAVNTLREGFGKSAGRMLMGEQDRVEAAGDDLVSYLRTRRAGSPFRLSRVQRCAVFAVYAVRAAR